MTTVTYIQHETPEAMFTFSNFVEYPAPAIPVGAKPYLYFTLGFKCQKSGFGVLLNDVRLSNGVFQNPYHKTAYRSRAHAYLNPTLAKAVEDAWAAAVSPLLPKWKLVEGAWEGLVFDMEKIAKAMDAPYKVWTKEGSEKARREKASKKVGIL